MEKKDLIEKLSKQIVECKKCDLYKTRNIPLVGDGSISSKVMLIGEAPGYHEDLEGKAFIGKAGKVLDQLLEFVKMKREDIYITNVIKCHPPQNRDPSSDEISRCMPYLIEQLKIIKPKIIITLGKYATQIIFRAFKLHFTGMNKLHGSLINLKTSYGIVKVGCCYHPALACYNPSMLKILLDDFNNILKHSSL